jgi:methylenetetrahydrofolate reductase (NADPH)
VKAGTNLEKILASGKFAVTAEAAPPKGTSAEVLREKGEALRGCCDAVNITDNQTAIVRMSSLAGCIIMKQAGLEPVMQMVVRDRNRLALQADILGGIAMGIGNFLCLSGDHQSFGNHPGAKGVFDIDSIQLIQTMQKMRDEKKFLNGEDISGEVPMFIGAAANPFADPFEYRVKRLAKKVQAGADFIQTQAIFDVDRFARYMEMVRAEGLDQQVHILAGIIPMKSAGSARYMKNNVSGIIVPDELVSRLEQAPKGTVKEEGLKITLEIIEKVKAIPGVHGIHIMAVGWEDIVPEIVERAGLMPRPVI